MYEPTRSGFSAYVPDLPGCVAAGDSLGETRELITGAIAMHITGLRDSGEAVPEPSVFEFVDVAL
jgi:predicted RNase H-like HicB family nuclease